MSGYCCCGGATLGVAFLRFRLLSRKKARTPQRARSGMPTPTPTPMPTFVLSERPPSATCTASVELALALLAADGFVTPVAMTAPSPVVAAVDGQTVMNWTETLGVPVEAVRVVAVVAIAVVADELGLLVMLT